MGYGRQKSREQIEFEQYEIYESARKYADNFLIKIENDDEFENRIKHIIVERNKRKFKKECEAFLEKYVDDIFQTLPKNLQEKIGWLRKSITTTYDSDTNTISCKCHLEPNFSYDLKTKKEKQIIIKAVENYIIKNPPINNIQISIRID